MQITKLKPNQIFVFGTNTKGIMGAGAAKQALIWGAMHGKPRGLVGSTYGIITKKLPNTFMGWNYITKQLIDLCEFAKKYDHLEFLLTDVGCGLAGGKREDLEKILDNLKLPPNIIKTWTMKNE